MKFGLFQTPYTRPERSPLETFTWAVDQAVAAENAGFSEFWAGQHFTLAWEAIPNPEMVLAAAARETSRITLAPGAHLLPYQHPAGLASQTSWLSHIAEGRYILGVATGVNPIDAQFHGLKNRADNLAMSIESLDIMEQVWSGEPFEYVGQYWTAAFPAQNDTHQLRDLRPHGGSMRIAMAGASPNSTSIQCAGSRGLIPLSFGGSPELVANHWENYLAGARETGRQDGLDRGIHHIAMEVFAADTDAEAERIVKEGPIGHAWREHLVPNEQGRARRAGIAPVWDSNSSMDELIRHKMVVGSPDTVAEKLQALIEKSGGWGTTLVFGHDFIDDPSPWNHSMELLANEVAPKIGSDVK
ncbi:LLM class flavin-dependent oxidoreductase [Actinomadura rugatobispora]|uniref:LLM class flavin-dependent oxidoreductase n=1 Tax=Actinomadura rugatobispora TaxID=1994 RepID=A0ABW1A6B8_9ACTN|nr:LLM class flavin-dependent oxidoreductase [Actinomadura rugatobispora]